MFQDDGAPAAPAPKKEIILPGQRSKAAPAAKAEAKAAAPKKQEVSEQGGDIDAKIIALPGETWEGSATLGNGGWQGHFFAISPFRLTERPRE